MTRWQGVLGSGVAAVLVACSWCGVTLAGADEGDLGRQARFSVIHAEQETLTPADLGALGSYEGTREGSAVRVTLTTTKLTYTPRGTFLLTVWTEPASDEENSRVGTWPGYGTSVAMTAEEFALAFHGGPAGPSEVTARDQLQNPVRMTIRVEGDRRVVDCALFTDQGRTQKQYGRLVIGVRGGLITDVAVSKKSHGLWGWKTVLDVTSSNLQRTRAGLALEDDGVLGYLTDLPALRRALAEPTSAVFRQIAQEQGW